MKKGVAMSDVEKIVVEAEAEFNGDETLPEAIEKIKEEEPKSQNKVVERRPPEKAPRKKKGVVATVNVSKEFLELFEEFKIDVLMQMMNTNPRFDERPLKTHIFIAWRCKIAEMVNALDTLIDEGK